MRFDIVVGNPPFSLANDGKTAGKKAVNLYPKFYSKSVELADIVCMIMPETGNQINASHNEFLKNTAHNIKYIDPAMFPGVGIKMWTVYYDKSKTPKVDNFFATFEVANDLDFQKGKVNLSTIKDSVCESGTRVVKAVYKHEGVIQEFVKPSAIVRGTLPDRGYVVLMPLTMGDDGWRVEIEQCQGQAVNVNVYYLLANTRAEADHLRSVVTSDDFIAKAKPKRGNQNVITITALKSIVI